MDAITIAAIAVPVVTLAELIKFSKIFPESWAFGLVLVLAAFGVGTWVLSQPDLPGRTDIFPIFSGYAMVVASAAGVYGFIRQTRSEDVMSTKKHVDDNEGGFIHPRFAVLLALSIATALTVSLSGCGKRAMTLEPGSSRPVSVRTLQILDALDKIRVTLKEFHASGIVTTDQYIVSLDKLEDAGHTAHRLGAALVAFETAATLAEQADARTTAQALIAALDTIAPTIAPGVSGLVSRINALVIEVNKVRASIQGPTTSISTTPFLWRHTQFALEV
ncbi:MAG: hypothetical protein E6R03_14920 [Hyphomicrobiaceae bacterium]|nr:MAG: hypothetical protein E6R03_14920 [Hyphomicrobiaceae bacterium]